FCLGVVLLFVGRFTIRRAIFAARRRGHLVHRVIIAGSRSHADQLADSLARQRRLGYQVLGVVTPTHEPSETTLAGHEVLGHVDDLAALTIESGCDVLFIAGGAFASTSEAKELAWALEQHPIQLIVAPSLTDVSGER